MTTTKTEKTENQAVTTERNPEEQTVIPCVELVLIHPGDENALLRSLPTRLELGQMSFAQWRYAVQALKRFHDLFPIYLADLIIYGRKNFGDEKVDETLETLVFDMADVLRAYAIGQLSLDLRTENLTSEHYHVLAKSLPNAGKEQGRWAAIATKERLTASELKASILKGKIVHQAEVEGERGSGSGVPNIEGLSLVFQRWEKQAGGEEKILEQPEQWKRKFLDEVHPIVELAHKVEESLPKEG